MSYYSGDGPSRDKLEAFIRTYLVYDGASVPDDLDRRCAMRPRSIPKWWPIPPLRRPSGPTALRTLWRMDLTRDRRLKQLQHPDLGAVGPRRQGQPAGRRADAGST